ncbi:MAG: hypothetical protein WA102_11830 [Candidatus Methanoperedens sp.]
MTTDYNLVLIGFILGFVSSVGFYHYKSYIEWKKDEKLTNKLLLIELKQTIIFLENIKKRFTDHFKIQTLDEVIKYMKTDQAKTTGSQVPLITEKISTRVYDDRYSKILSYTDYFSEEVIDSLTDFYNNRISYLNDLRDAIERISWTSGNPAIAEFTLAYCINLNKAIEEAKDLKKSLPKL